MRSLIPFLYLLYYHMAANSEELLEAALTDFERYDVLGQQRMRSYPIKGRASYRRIYRTHPVTEDIGNPAFLIDYIRTWSSRIRSTAHVTQQHKLFLVVSRVDPKARGKPLAAVSPTLASQKSTIEAARRSFCRSHELPDIPFKCVRPTTTDLADQLSGGDILAVSAIAGHRTPQTTFVHYTSAAARRRDEQSIALSQSKYFRWSSSGRKIDPRGRLPDADTFCASPGFLCNDPFDSPWPQSQKGDLCAAYGFCPMCPLAAVDTTSAYSLARLLQLRALIADSLDSVSPERWYAIWVPCQQKLDRVWLPTFKDADVLDAATKLELSELPPID